MNKYISLGLILIFLGLSVKAITLEGNFTAEAYQSQPLEKVFTLCNNSTHSESYSINEFGEYSHWMHVKPEELSLSAGECEDIYAFITPEPYAREGNYELGIRIRNSSTLEKIIELTVLQGHTLSLSVEDSYKEAAQCEERNYSLKIKNTGRFEERTKIEVDGLNELWYDLDSDEPVLEKGESTTVKLSVKAPCNAERKAYEFTVKASIPYTDFETEEVLTYKIVNEQEVMIDLDKEVSACKDSTETEEITFRNNGRLDDELKLQLIAPEWALLERESISIGAGESKSIDLIFEKNDEEEGIYEAEIRVISERFNTSYSQKFDISLKDCYGLKLEKVEGESTSCLEEEFKYVFSLTNIGLKEVEVKLSSTGIPAEIEDSSLTIQAGESEEVEVKFNLENEEKGVKQFKFIVDSAYFTKTAEYEIELLDCFNAGIQIKELRLCKCVPMHTFFTVSNPGKAAQTYSITSSVEWIEPELTEIELQPDESKEIKLIMDTPCDATETEYGVKAESEKNLVSDTKGIIYERKKQCFGIEMTNSQGPVDVNAGKGSIETLYITNQGVTKQKVTVRVEDNDWIFFDPKVVEIESGETKEVYVYFSPPLDFGEDEVIVNVEAMTDYGYRAEETLKLKIAAGGIDLEISPEEISVEGIKVTEIKDTKEKELELSIKLTNNTGTSLKIEDINSSRYALSYKIKKPVLKKGESTVIELTFRVGEEVDLSSLLLPLSLNTDKGVYEKGVLIEVETEEEEEEVTTTGLAVFTSAQSTTVVLLIIVIVLIIAFIALKAKEAEEEKKPRKRTRKKKK